MLLIIGIVAAVVVISVVVAVALFKFFDNLDDIMKS